MLLPNLLVWEDTFTGEVLDRNKWEPEVNAFGGGNHEEQIYTDYPRNVRIENGKLILEARREETGIQGTVRPWSSGRVRTKHRGDWTYGRFEASIRMPRGQGYWPAFWMLPTDEELGPWPLSGEIDIVEYAGQAPRSASAAGSWPVMTAATAGSGRRCARWRSPGAWASA
jgi:beta-glucanase (GH16 family)